MSLSRLARGGSRLFHAKPLVVRNPISTTAIQADGSAILFLKRPPGLLEPKLRGLPEGERHLRVLMELQRKQSRPIYIVPQAFDLDPWLGQSPLAGRCAAWT